MPLKNPITRFTNAIKNKKHMQRHTKDAIETLNRVIKNFIYNEKHPAGYKKTTTNTRFLPTNNQTADKCAIQYITQLGIKNISTIESWRTTELDDKTFDITGIPTNHIIGAGYRIDDKSTLHAHTTNLVHIVLERTDDENGYKLTTAHPTISQAHINEFKTKYPKESHKISIARTSNPRILRLLKDTPAYQKLQKEEKEKKHTG